jgi:hypothetical protein
MGRHGMWGASDIEDQWAYICFRGAVASSLRGKRGQKFLKELITALESLPEKKLIGGELELNGQYCALGCVGASRGLDMSTIDTWDYDKLSEIFNISPTMIREIEWINDETVYARLGEDKDEKRWKVVYDWAKSQVIE